MLKKLLVAGAAAAALGTVVAAPAYAADPRKDGYGQHEGHGKKKDNGYESFTYFDDNDYYSHEFNREDSENDTKINQILPLQLCNVVNALALASGDCTNGPSVDNVEIERN